MFLLFKNTSQNYKSRRLDIEAGEFPLIENYDAVCIVDSNEKDEAFELCNNHNWYEGSKISMLVPPPLKKVDEWYRHVLDFGTGGEVPTASGIKIQKHSWYCSMSIGDVLLNLTTGEAFYCAISRWDSFPAASFLEEAAKITLPLPAVFPAIKV